MHVVALCQRQVVTKAARSARPDLEGADIWEVDLSNSAGPEDIEVLCQRKLAETTKNVRLPLVLPAAIVTVKV
jgi:hypothetical protein